MSIRIAARDGGVVAAPWMGRAGEVPAPYEFREAVELYARKSGRHGEIAFHPLLGCYVVHLSLKPDDPKLKAWREQRVGAEPKESICLHYQPKPGAPYEAIDLAQLGPSGLVRMLEEADTWSGTGKYRSMQEAVQAHEHHNRALKESIRAAARDNARMRGRDRDQYLKPKVAVSADLNATHPSPDKAA